VLFHQIQTIMHRNYVCLLFAFFCFNISLAQQRLLLDKKPFKSEISLLNDTTLITGSIFELKDSSILVSSSLLKSDYYLGNYEVAELYIDEIFMIKPKKKLRIMGGALLGAGIGFCTSMIIGLISGDDDGYILSFSATEKGLILSPFGVGIGAITGGIIGSIKIEIPLDGSLNNYMKSKKKLCRYTIKCSTSP